MDSSRTSASPRRTRFAPPRPVARTPASRRARQALSRRASLPISSSSAATRSKLLSGSRSCGSGPRGSAANACTRNRRNREGGAVDQRSIGARPPRFASRRSAARRSDLGLQRAVQAAPHLPVLAQLVLVVVHLGPCLERGILRILSGQEGQVVHVENADEFLDRGRMIVDPNVDPAVV